MAHRLALADQEIEGLPLNRIPATAALAGDTNAAAQIDARLAAINSLRQENAQLTAKLRERESALIQIGEKYEHEKSKSIWHRIRAALIGTLGLGGLIALCIFFPPAVPLIGRAFGFVIDRVPALASAVGLVSHRAYDALITGVGNAREAFRAKANPSLDELDHHLATSQDAVDKKLIAARRVALNV